MHLQFSELFLCLHCVQSPVQTSDLSREEKSGAAKQRLDTQLVWKPEGAFQIKLPQCVFQPDFQIPTSPSSSSYSNTNQVASQLSLQLIFYIFLFAKLQPLPHLCPSIASKFCLTSNLLYHCGL